jgi:hypothetical protein
MNEVVQKGRAEYPDFDTAAGYVVSMSADQMELRHALGELGDDAHRVVARLADDVENAGIDQRLFCLRRHADRAGTEAFFGALYGTGRI